MTNMSDVAVVVVNYRTPALTVACVESVLRSEGVRPRVVVVDNASGDDSVARLREAFGDAPAVTVLARDVNDGYAGGNNAGVALVRAAAGGARWETRTLVYVLLAAAPTLLAARAARGHGWR